MSVFKDSWHYAIKHLVMQSFHIKGGSFGRIEKGWSSVLVLNFLFYKIFKHSFVYFIIVFDKFTAFAEDSFMKETSIFFIYIYKLENGERYARLLN